MLLRYPTNPVYRVHWGARELKHCLGLLADGGGKLLSAASLKAQAALATKAGAKKLGPLGPALLAASAAKNPWHVAKTRADKTGVIVADLLARTETESYVLIGHSLGGRVMAVAAENLGTKPDSPRVEAVHLLGAAIGARNEFGWTALAEAVDKAVFNYHSRDDDVLRIIYRTAQGGQVAAGCEGFDTKDPKIVNVDVTADVPSHSAYFANVTLR